MKTTEVMRSDDGVRIVRTWYGDGDAWRVWIIMSRDWVLRELRELKRRGTRGEWLLPENFAPGVLLPYYQGPGRTFADPPCRLRYGRRWIVVTQHGGWDV